MIEALLQAERLLIHGMVDQAEQIYANAITQDPRNAIAMVGLARVALERGDEQLAYARASSALQIDPQNAAAQRLEARLAEVFATRRQSPAPVAALPVADAAPEPRSSEQTFLTRNPSMAEHAAMEERRAVPHASPLGARTPRGEPPPDESPPGKQRPGFWRRIIGE